MDLKNKKILVTGGAGFLGSYIVEQLQAKGIEPFVSRKRDYDLTHWDDAERLFQDAKPELIIHLAAEVGGIGANRDNPGLYWYANLMMGAHMLELARLHRTEKIVTLGTICEYPKFTPMPFLEENLWDGYPEETNAPYGIAKKTILVGAQAYRNQYGLNAIHLLPINLYGPRDNFDPASSHVIPALIRKIMEAKKASQDYIDVWGTGTASREFLYVEDAAEGIVKALERYDKPEPINLGSGMEITIKDLVEKIAKPCDFHGKIRWDASKPDGQPRRMLDVSKAEREFGFKAKTSFDEGLTKTINWYEKTSAR